MTTPNPQPPLEYSQQLINRLKALSKSPLAAAVAWQGYLLLGRGMVYIKPDRTPSTQLILTHYCSLEQFWKSIPTAERTLHLNRSFYDLLSSYCQLTEYVVCYPKNASAELEMTSFDHLEPPAEYTSLKSKGFFQSGDGLLITFNYS